MVPAVQSVGSSLAAPRAALRLARAVYALDLHDELAESAPGCRDGARRRHRHAHSAAHCRAVARLAGADYQELDVAGGHVWSLVAAPQLRRRLAL